MCALHIKAGLSLRNWFIGFPDILVVVVMLYLWGNCWSLSLCSPNLFYILLWPLVLSRPLRQLLLKKRKRQVHIDQDLHVYCQDCDLFYCVFVSGTASHLCHSSKAPRTLVLMSSEHIWILLHALGYTFLSCCKSAVWVYLNCLQISVILQQIVTAMLQQFSFFCHRVWKAKLLNSSCFFPFF